MYNNKQVALPLPPQGAAGTFQLLQEKVFAHLQTAPTPDLSAESTTALIQLMLGQAQETFCIKASRGEFPRIMALGDVRFWLCLGKRHVFQ